jgi:hypothetical protein
MPLSAAAEAPAQRLAGFITKFGGEHQRLIRAARRALRARLPSADELVYDNYNFLVIGYCASRRPSDCIISLVAAASGVSICFMNGANLPDPEQVLKGHGKQTRFIRLESAATIGSPPVEAMLKAAIDDADPPLRTTRKGTLVIRSVSAKQRPRRR